MAVKRESGAKGLYAEALICGRGAIQTKRILHFSDALSRAA